MVKKTAYLIAGFAFLMLFTLYAQPDRQAAFAESHGAKHTMTHEKHAAPMMTKEQKIAFAMTAAPAEIAKNATIIDMTEMNTEPKQLRSGSNGWICYAMHEGPMCLDKVWQQFIEAWMTKKEPKVEGMGISYMLAGDKGTSNTDPFAEKPTADNHWVVSPAHIMVLFPDPKMYDAYPADWKGGGPWVMWKGTPYAHLMVPVSATEGAMLMKK